MPVFDIGNSAKSLTDEAELQSLVSDTGTYSLEDLKAALRQLGETGDPDEAEATEREEHIALLADDVSVEVSRRALTIGKAYPFSFDGAVLASSDWGSTPGYIFLLLASMPVSKGQRVGAVYFENLVTEALKRYLGGRALRFGWPNRAPVPTHPQEAVDYLAGQLSERRNPLGHIRSRDKDMGLDTVAWKPFADQRRGQVVLLGQCATGASWKDKIGDLRACEQMVVKPLVC